MLSSDIDAHPIPFYSLPESYIHTHTHSTKKNNGYTPQLVVIQKSSSICLKLPEDQN